MLCQFLSCNADSQVLQGALLGWTSTLILQERLARRLSSLLSSEGVSNNTQVLWMQYMVSMDGGLAALVSKVSALHVRD